MKYDAGKNIQLWCFSLILAHLRIFGAEMETSASTAAGELVSPASARCCVRAPQELRSLVLYSGQHRDGDILAFKGAFKSLDLTVYEQH